MRKAILMVTAVTLLFASQALFASGQSERQTVHGTVVSVQQIDDTDFMLTLDGKNGTYQVKLSASQKAVLKPEVGQTLSVSGAQVEGSDNGTMEIEAATATRNGKMIVLSEHQKDSGNEMEGADGNRESKSGESDNEGKEGSGENESAG